MGAVMMTCLVVITVLLTVIAVLLVGTVVVAVWQSVRAGGKP